MRRPLNAFVVIFLLFFTTQVHAVLFQNYIAYPTGSHPESVAIGDLNGDNRNDVVMCTSLVGNTNDNSILVFYQNASNQFDQLCLLSSLIEFWTNTLRAPALRHAALIVLTLGMIVTAGAISAGAPAVMKPVCMSITR